MKRRSSHSSIWPIAPLRLTTSRGVWWPELSHTRAELMKSQIVRSVVDRQHLFGALSTFSSQQLQMMSMSSPAGRASILYSASELYPICPYHSLPLVFNFYSLPKPHRMPSKGSIRRQSLHQRAWEMCTKSETCKYESRAKPLRYMKWYSDI